MEDADNMGKTHVWLDCDPGHDDAFAIILAGMNPKINLLGISTVGGNMPVSHTTTNALKVLFMSGLHHIPVAKGQHKPLLRKQLNCPEIHGDSGLESEGHQLPPLPEEYRPVSEKAVIYMAKAISDCDHKVTIVATGALTNVALFLTLYPELKSKIEQIVIMGGALGIGNTHPVAEFNIQVDPEAAKIVFESGLLAMVPLEVTHTVLVTPKIVQRIKSFNTLFGDILVDLLLFFAKTYKEVFHFQDPPLHDPCAVAYVLRPDIFKTRRLRVDVETGSPLSSGQTVCDVFDLEKRPDEDKNVNVAMEIDVDAFWELMMDAVTRADDRSPVGQHASSPHKS